MILKFEFSAFAMIAIFLNHALSESCDKNEKCVLKSNCKITDGHGILEKR